MLAKIGPGPCVTPFTFIEKKVQLLAFKGKILYTVKPKTATSPCVHFEVAASPTEKKNIASPRIHFEPL